MKSTIRSRRGRRITTRRSLTAATKLFWNRQADALLAHAESIWAMASTYDTAVRDNLADGIAHIVHSAYDCRAAAMEFADTGSWYAFIQYSTAQWFRDRGFVEWYCAAASSLFNTTPPRHLSCAFDSKTLSVRVRRVRSANARKRKRSTSREKSGNAGE